MLQWTNTHTAEMFEVLTSKEMLPKTTELVGAWNELELLGIDLADQLEKLMAGKTQYDDINWSEIAEQLALQLVGVNEDELIRRRKRYEQD